MKKTVKEYAFAVVILLLAAAAVVMVFRNGEKTVYVPQEYTAPKEESTRTKEPEIIEIHKTELVYYYNDSDKFHIKKGCSGIDETLEGHPCGTALEQGKTPCGRCMKNYRIID